MRHIILKEETPNIRSPQLLDSYNIKVGRLIKQLAYLDRVGIPATVTLQPHELNGEVITGIIIKCEDPGFKLVIAKLLDIFTQEAVLLTANNNEGHPLGSLR